MRTTVTLDSDVERILRDEVHRSRKSFKDVINEAVRTALKPRAGQLPKLLPPVSMGVMPGIDPASFNNLADELEADAYRRLATPRKAARR